MSGALEIEKPVAFVDMAGTAGVPPAVHTHFADRLALSAVVGSTHHQARTSNGAPLPDPLPAFFFAPDGSVQRRTD